MANFRNIHHSWCGCHSYPDTNQSSSDQQLYEASLNISFAWKSYRYPWNYWDRAEKHQRFLPSYFVSEETRQGSTNGTSNRSDWCKPRYLRRCENNFSIVSWKQLCCYRWITQSHAWRYHWQTRQERDQNLKTISMKRDNLKESPWISLESTQFLQKADPHHWTHRFPFLDNWKLTSSWFFSFSTALLSTIFLQKSTVEWNNSSSRCTIRLVLIGNILSINLWAFIFRIYVSGLREVGLFENNFSSRVFSFIGASLFSTLQK